MGKVKVRKMIFSHKVKSKEVEKNEKKVYHFSS
jgi:hypothetical protein